ncbi:hypothetical protein BLA29_003764 [Euroglyphus maynei]|uniref:Uncharacterized protein n=1 Tax=Euroglyphus maynei TaxID=6958 RepID=A0A1Y3AYE9_EURMA|nr:hypothetical protein BLA29_003764 [Euroglyphus maynei]
MTKHLDDLVKRQLKKQRKLKLKNERKEQPTEQNDMEQSCEENEIDEHPAAKRLKTDEENDCPTLVDTSKTAIVKSLLSNLTFKDLADKVSEKTLTAIDEMGFTHMTEIQSKSVPHLLEGK